MTREEKQKAIDALKISVPVRAMTQEEFNEYIQAINQVMDWLEQEPCDDAISKSGTLTTMIKELGIRSEDYLLPAEKKLYEIVKNMPPVTPQPKTGQWVNGEYCSECGCDVPTFIIDWRWQEEKDMDAKYCPNCGIKMKGKSEEV